MKIEKKAPDYGLAQSILGVDFITHGEVTKARPSFTYTVEEITALAQSLPSEDVLNWCKENGYAVMPAPPTEMSILDFDVRGSWSARILKNHYWFIDDNFARNERTCSGWLILKKEPVVGSIGRTWSEQKSLLSKDLETVPNTAEIWWFITTYFAVRRVRLFGEVFVRTSSTVPECILESVFTFLARFRVVVGRFNEYGFEISATWQGGRSDGVGLSVKRRPLVS